MADGRGTFSDRSVQLVHLRFEPLWLYVDAVREFCGFFTQTTFQVDGAGDRVGMVVHELVENAIRHGDDRELELRIELSDISVTVSVANTVTEQQGARLREAFARLDDTPAEVAYVAAMRKAALTPTGTGGLGFARARHEGRVDLELNLAGARAEIIARGTL